MADALRFGLRRGAAGTGLLNALRVHNGKGALPPLRTRVRVSTMLTGLHTGTPSRAAASLTGRTGRSGRPGLNQKCTFSSRLAVFWSVVKLSLSWMPYLSFQ